MGDGMIIKKCPFAYAIEVLNFSRYYELDATFNSIIIE